MVSKSILLHIFEKCSDSVYNFLYCVNYIMQSIVVFLSFVFASSNVLLRIKMDRREIRTSSR